MIFIDVFVDDDIVLWLKDGKKDVFVKDKFTPRVYLDTFNEDFSRKVLSGQKVRKVKKKHMVKGEIDVLEVTFDNVWDFRRNFRKAEKTLRNVGTFFNADVQLEEMYMFEKGLYPLAQVDENLKNIDDVKKYEYDIPDFKVARVKIGKDGIEFNKNIVSVNEFKILFEKYDPDIIFISGQQKEFISLCAGLKLNRYGKDNFNLNKKGNSYFSYGQAYYRDTPIYLKGRLLINSSSFMVDDFNLYSVVEGSRICRMRIQRLASHSVGSAITNLLSYVAIRKDYLVPYQVGVYERIKPFRELVMCDRGAYTLEPLIGIHENVIELDFVSMFPSIISRHNLSPENLNCSCCNEKIVGTNYHFCTKNKGIVPIVCDFLIDRRRYFKSQKDHVSKSKVGFLKWLLVVIFGFQSFRNKKIGCIEVHESINAVARHALHRSVRAAEDMGFTVIHGIVDSMYVKGDLTKIKELISRVNNETRLELEFKKKYRFMSFLPSVNANYMPVPNAFYGVAIDGDVKVRGIELRQRSAPGVVKNLQLEIIDKMKDASDVKSIVRKSLGLLRNHIASLDNATMDDLAIKVRIGQEKYAVNCAQKIIKKRFLERGEEIMPGQSVRYIIENFGSKSYVPVDEFRGLFDKVKYIDLMKKAFVRLFSCCGIESVEEIEQTKISDFGLLDFPVNVNISKNQKDVLEQN